MSGTKEQVRQDPEGIEFVEASWDVPQRYHADPLLLKFFEALKEKRLLAAKAPGDKGRVIFPPTGFCEVTFSPITELVPVGPKGRIVTFTLLPGNTPKLIVFVHLEGADTASAGFLRGVPEEQMTSLSLVGASCKVAFADEPKGDWSDFWFELID